MSEQTPGSTEGLSGAEPSMEDILASIRKIISDDEPVALESPEDVVPVDLVETSAAAGLSDMMRGISMDSNDLTSDAVLDAAVVQPAVVSDEGDSVDLNIEDVLAGLDEDILGADAEDVALETFTQNEMPTAVLDESDLDVFNLATGSSSEIAPDANDDILSFLDADIPLADEAPLESALAMPELATIPAAAAAAVITGLNLEKTEGSSDTAVANDDFDMDSLLDDILIGEDETDSVFAEIDLNENLVEADFSAQTVSAEESDLELVKSLMADLTDDPDGLEAQDDLDALLSFPGAADNPDLNEALALPEGELEVPDVDVAALETLDLQTPELETAELETSELETSELETSAVETSEIDLLDADIALANLETGEAPETEEDILGDILDMTIEDELQSHPEDLAFPEDIAVDELTSLDDVLDAEQNNVAAAIEFDDDASEEVLPSLSEIAAAAEADAVAVETAQAPIAAAATAGLATALGGAALFVSDDDAETDEEAADFVTAEIERETEIAEAEIEPTSEPTPNIEETSMPVKAVKTDAILNEVTETAAAGAFAELNQVVEDKAVFNESGPRIGDLVQDALRPMLKEWLDANLKGIVERAVTKEVKRISSGK